MPPSNADPSLEEDQDGIVGNVRRDLKASVGFRQRNGVVVVQRRRWLRRRSGE